MKFPTIALVVLSSAISAEEVPRYLRKKPKPDNEPQGPKPGKGPNGVAVGFYECRPFSTEDVCNAKGPNAPTTKEYKDGQWCGCYWTGSDCEAIEC